ncbi:hypothetical protein EYF80_038723 [Liparis tanakae]|uniref:Uncharacterized protein n=1 Tax=Liparis tanakae TaxID=230148 RepID=A0A4Z2GC00_9TELE|nr:hypothetical protein EYF80_038723 [Liparis tanakae]
MAGSCRPVTMWPSSVTTSQCLQSKQTESWIPPQLHHLASPDQIQSPGTNRALKYSKLQKEDRVTDTALPDFSGYLNPRPTNPKTATPPVARRAAFLFRANASTASSLSPMLDRSTLH